MYEHSEYDHELQIRGRNSRKTHVLPTLQLQGQASFHDVLHSFLVTKAQGTRNMIATLDQKHDVMQKGDHVTALSLRMVLLFNDAEQPA